MSDLRAVQEMVHAAITGQDAPALEHVVRGSERLSADERLALYRRSYRMRMLDALGAPYPALRHLLGREAFDEFGLDYLRERPSRSYTLLRLAHGFPDHLASTRPEPGDEDAEWAQLVIDLAYFERAFVEVYEGEGTERRRLPSAHDLPAEPEPSWLAATVEPAPCLRLVHSSYPVGPYALAVRRGERPPPPARAASHLALCRRDYVVTVTALSAPEHEALARLADGRPVSDLGLDPAAAWALTRRCADGGCFLSINLPPSDRQRSA